MYMRARMGATRRGGTCGRNASVREVRVRVGGAEAARGGVTVHGGAGGGGAVDDGAEDVVGDHRPVDGVARAGVADDEVAGDVDVDAAVLGAAVVAFDAVVAAGDVDAGAVGLAVVDAVVAGDEAG